MPIVLVLFVVILIAEQFLPLRIGNAPQPNIIFITVDAMRADAFEQRSQITHGPSAFRDLRRSGTYFSQAVSQASWTIASVPSFLSSAEPSRTGIVSPATMHQRLGMLPTVPKKLREGGYRTSLVSAHPLLFEEPHDMFDDMHILPMQDAAMIVNDALALLKKRRSGDKPFFLWLYFMDLHEVPLPEPIDRSTFAPPTGFVSKYLGIYRERLQHVDQELARFRDALGPNIPAEQQAWIINADHGEAYWEHQMLFDHSLALWDFLIHVPLLISYPERLARGHREHCQVQLLDVAPTMLALAGAPQVPAYRGKNLLLPNADRCTSTAFSSHHEIDFTTGTVNYAMFSARSWPWHLIRREEGGKPTEALYNLATDPYELRDVKATAPAAHARINQQLGNWQQENSAVQKTLSGTESPDALNTLKALGYMQ